jgi:hypothetical protein
MMTLCACLVFATAQTPAPKKPVAPPARPSGVIAKLDLFPEDKQWEALACSPRLLGSDGELGTAVVVGIRDGSAFLLTANHVVSGNADRKLEFFTKENYGKKPLEIKIAESPVFRNLKADLALLKVDLGKIERKFLEIPSPNLNARPRKFPAPALSIGCSNGETPTCRDEQIEAKMLVRKANDGGTFFWQTKDISIAGRSGGPLLIKNAEGNLSLIGICTATQDSRGYYTHLDEIHVALKEGGYSWLWETNKRR